MRNPLAELAEYVGGGAVMVLTGAGMSTDSGIPDYRGPSGSLRRYRPMSFQTFLSDAAARRRYWARSHLGWRRFAAAKPNLAHFMVARLEQLGLTTGIVTQNVDGLHQAAGAADVVDLHGRLDRVTCLACKALCSRDDLDRRLREANPFFTADVTATNPDGDVEIADDGGFDSRFNMVDCPACGGILKPDVVFFGENVPAPTVEHCYEVVESSRFVLVLGSSLTVMSGYRFVKRAVAAGIPVAIVNRGATRGDGDASLIVDASLADVLPDLVASVGQYALAPFAG